MPRDDFSSKTIDILAKRVGYLCSNPACRKGTVGSHADPLKATIIGIAAHITAASAGGPRFDPDLSEFDWSSIETGSGYAVIAPPLSIKRRTHFQFTCTGLEAGGKS
jgi:hypothetical protein